MRLKICYVRNRSRSVTVRIVLFSKMGRAQNVLNGYEQDTKYKKNCSSATIAEDV